MDKASDKGAKSIEIAGRIIHEARDVGAGVHIMAIGWESRIPAILQAAGLAAAA
jgi:5,10-methylenetetrahydrofolate reductase